MFVDTKEAISPAEHIAGPVEEVLVKARAVFTGPEKWTRGAFRHRHSGDEAYCSLGAIRLVTGESLAAGSEVHAPVAREAIAVLEAAVPKDPRLPAHLQPGVISYNDFIVTNFAEITSLFDRAIEEAKERKV